MSIKRDSDKIELNNLGKSSESRVPSSPQSNAPIDEAQPSKDGVLDIVKNFGLLGWVAFGGPQAHISILQDRFVHHKKWITEAMFVEILGLGQGIPGPTSTQMVVGVAAVRGGIAGAILALLLWCLPGLIIMLAAGVGGDYLFEVEDNDIINWVESGLSSAAVALVAVAAYRLGAKLCTSPLTQLLMSASTAVTLLHAKPYIFPSLLILGGFVSLLAKKFGWEGSPDSSSTSASASPAQKQEEAQAKKQEEEAFRHSQAPSRTIGLVLILLFVVGLVICLLLRHALVDVEYAAQFEAFFRTGSLIFGGGQVVLPMLLEEVVSTGWMTEREFFAGFALVQALPGPLFNFSAYLGAVIGGVSMGLLCWVALFAPGTILILAVIPFWQTYRQNRFVNDILVGVNAAAVGLVVAAVFTLWQKAVPGVDTLENVFFVLSVAAVLFGQLQAPVVIIGAGCLMPLFKSLEDGF